MLGIIKVSDTKTTSLCNSNEENKNTKCLFVHGFQFGSKFFLSDCQQELYSWSIYCEFCDHAVTARLMHDSNINACRHTYKLSLLHHY